MKKPQNQRPAGPKTLTPKASDAEKSRTELEASIRADVAADVAAELAPQIKAELEPKIREELEKTLRAEFETKAKEAAAASAKDEAKKKSGADAAKAKTEDMAVRITANKDGFRRCGVAHPATATDYPADKFSGDDMKVLENEPRLVVEHL